MTAPNSQALDILVADRIAGLAREGASIRMARFAELARTCCAAVRPSRIAAALASVRRVAFRGAAGSAV